MAKAKFGTGEVDGRAYVYPNEFSRDATSDGNERLLLAPANSQITLLRALLKCLPEPFRVLYVLVVPRSDTVAAARYELAHEFTQSEISVFLDEYSDYFESDGRHHLWVASPGHGMIVYDRHNVLYAYGPLECFIKAALAFGLTEGRPEIPSPHWHRYHPEYDAFQNRLLTEWEWIEKPLGANDEA